MGFSLGAGKPVAALAAIASTTPSRMSPPHVVQSTFVESLNRF
jgi:hypothetical protein